MSQNLPNPPIQEPFTEAGGRLTRMASQWLKRMLDTVNRVNGTILTGSGNPNTVVAAPVGTIYLNTAGGAGTTLWVKEAGGTSDLGWVGK